MPVQVIPADDGSNLYSCPKCLCCFNVPHDNARALAMATACCVSKPELAAWQIAAQTLGAKVRSTRKAVAMAQKVATLPGVLRRLCAEQNAALEALIDHCAGPECAPKSQADELLTLLKRLGDA